MTRSTNPLIIIIIIIIILPQLSIFVYWPNYL